MQACALVRIKKSPVGNCGAATLDVRILALDNKKVAAELQLFYFYQLEPLFFKPQSVQNVLSNFFT